MLIHTFILMFDCGYWTLLVKLMFMDLVKEERLLCQEKSTGICSRVSVAVKHRFVVEPFNCLLFICSEKGGVKSHIKKVIWGHTFYEQLECFTVAGRVSSRCSGFPHQQLWHHNVRGTVASQGFTSITDLIKKKKKIALQSSFRTPMGSNWTTLKDLCLWLKL